MVKKEKRFRINSIVFIFTGELFGYDLENDFSLIHKGVTVPAVNISEEKENFKI